ncbi:EAL domain-containing protein [Vibrio sp. S11_S32]|uniref:EAL domain-containing protein n=1 Tax=Vibrio sp. S11_S32 TaxID=2720225 RepID=UPI0016818B78|nr:EAL domain-containing protein [Vibrio sp. S11_S32]MBD1576638.1 EAL domain-containing protein [Vibrio sp. S11_S32]
MRFFKDDAGNHFAKYKNLILSSVFQPIFNSNDTIIGVEVLILMKDENGIRVCPGFYFSDQNPVNIDKMAIDLISRILHVNNFANSQYQDLQLFLNLLPNSAQKINSQCQQEVRFINQLKQLNVSSSQIVLELLEMRCDDVRELRASVKKINEHGFHVAIDDYGQEYSNQDRVNLISPHIVKIDRGLLTEFMQGSKEKLLDALKVARNCGAKTVIEGIECQEQLDSMRSLNIDMYQGYFLAMPEPMIPVAA